jgi:Uma2 family endonuclease
MAQQAVLTPLIRETWFPMTWEEFLDWSPDEGQSEWVDGRGIAYTSNCPRHEQVLQFLNFLFQGFVRIHNLGEVFTTTVVMRLHARPSGRMPDLFVVLPEHRDRLRSQWYDRAADLGLEVLSERSTTRDLRDKMHGFATAGMPGYVVADGRVRGVTFLWHRLGADGGYALIEPDAEGRSHSQVLPGFWIDPRWLAQDPLPDPIQCLLEIAPETVRRYFRRLLGEPG